MSAIVRRFPCGCTIEDGLSSCRHVDAGTALAMGRHLERLNLEATRAQAAKGEVK